MGAGIPPSTLFAVVDGVSRPVSTIVAPTGATVSGVSLMLPAGGGGQATQYAVFVTEPQTEARRDVAPWELTVRVAPPPPAGTLVRVYRDGAQVVSGQILSGDTVTVTVPQQTAGSYSFYAAIAPLGTPYQSDAITVHVGAQAPIVEIVDPAPATDVAVGALPVTIRVRHESAAHAQLSVQLTTSRTWATATAAVWQSGEPTDPGGAIYVATATIDSQANYWLQARAYDATPGGAAALSARVLVCSLPNWVEFTTEGATFNPQVELSGPATVLWVPSEGAQSSALEPDWDWGTVAQRTVRLTVTPWSALHLLNFGFNRGDDEGREALPATYNRPNQHVSAMSNPGRAISLYALLAAHNPFAGTLDLSGFEQLVWLECFQSSLSSVVLSGCTSLRRLCVEQCALSTLDIRDQANCLYDLRAAAQQTGALEITMARMAIEYHFCVRSQILTTRNAAGSIVTGADFYALLPSVEELWDFQDSRPGACAPRSPYLRSVQCYQNAYSSIDVQNQFPLGRNGELLASHQGLSAVNLAGCHGLVSIDLHHCNLSTQVVDEVLDTVASWGTTYGTLLLAENSGPSPNGASLVTQLRARGWTVTVEPTVESGVNVDEFNRAAGEVGNGWTALFGAVTGAINGAEQLVLNAGAYTVFGNAGSLLPANYRVETAFPDATLAVGFFGLVARWANGTGVRLLFYGRTTPHIGNASGWNDGEVAVVVTNGFPASWALNQTHTLALSCVGTRCAIICDGQEYGYALVTTNAALAGTAYGFCGESNNRLFDRAAAVAL